MSLDVQLERLKRRYDKSVKSYDFIELLDLAHTLRVLTETLDEGDKKTGRDFKVLTPHKKIRRLIKKEDHIFMHLPDPITTYSVGPQGDARPQFFFPEDFNGTVWGNFKTQKNKNEFKISWVFITNNQLGEKEQNEFYKFIDRGSFTKVRYSQYMKRPIIYFKLKGHDPLHITREHLVKRVANEYKASHAQKDDFQIENIFSGPVEEFMRFEIASLPIPIYAILHIAKDILKYLKN